MAPYYLCCEIYICYVPLNSLNHMISAYMSILILTTLCLTNVFVLASLKFIPLSFIDL